MGRTYSGIRSIAYFLFTIKRFSFTIVEDMKQPTLSKMQRQYLMLFSVSIVVISGGMWGKGVYDAKKVLEAPVSRFELTETGVKEGDIPALSKPKYDSVFVSDTVLSDSLSGIDVEIAGEHRFYPLQILNWHEVVNDTWGGKDVAVTWSPLCGTGIVYDRDVEGSVVTLASSGKVYNDDTVLKDAETGSLWVQALGESVEGAMTGKKLTQISSTMMTWSEWKDAYPSGLVLSTNTGFIREYGRNPYAGYEKKPDVYFPVMSYDTSHEPKEVVTMNGVTGYWFCLSAIFSK